jgi:non-lysosomal glucosylceramidase
MLSMTGTPIPSQWSRAAFPLGGIGTGNVSIGARGELRDWELQNGPNKGGANPCSLFAISVAVPDAPRVTRVLEAVADDRRDWDDGGGLTALAGLPRFRSSTLRGEYPIVQVDFDDDVVPVNVRLTAFTPLRPLDADASGIPAAVLRYSVTNTMSRPASVTVAGSLSHLGGTSPGQWRAAPQRGTVREEADLRGIHFDVDMDPADASYGTMSLLTTAREVSAMPEWPRSRGNLFWNLLRSEGRLRPATEEESAPVPPAWFDRADRAFWSEWLVPNRRTGSLAITEEIPAGATRDFEFVLAWHFPNRAKGWPGDPLMPGADSVDLGMTRNHYATLWPDSWAAGTHLLRDLAALEADTVAFHDALFGSTLDPALTHAAASSIVVARSTTCFRVEGGDFFGWEGCGDHSAAGGGTCTHVWNYAQTIAWLFPELERNARRIEYLHETEADGRQYFRTNRVFGGAPFDWPGAVDGQLGTLVRLYREWRFSGDTDFLVELWPAARASLDYVLREWDRDRDGVLDALMHNTYDIEFDGSEPLSNILLLAALTAAVRMADEVGDGEARTRFGDALAVGAPRIDELLFNGEYFEQRTDDVDRLRSQYGTGVLSDQLFGQLLAHLTGLGDLLPREHLTSAISAVYRYNFQRDLSAHDNVERAYALGDEAGLVVCTWPHGGRPAHPPYFSDEVWTGIEYQVAAELAFVGFPEEALELVHAVRARHSGRYRSPWNEIEAGNHYARSMAAWAVFIAFSGVQYDAPRRWLSVSPQADGRYFFSAGTGWGWFEVRDSGLSITLERGVLRLDTVELHGREVGHDLHLQAGQSVTLRMEG